MSGGASPTLAINAVTNKVGRLGKQRDVVVVGGWVGPNQSDPADLWIVQLCNARLQR